MLDILKRKLAEKKVTATHPFNEHIESKKHPLKMLQDFQAAFQKERERSHNFSNVLSAFLGTTLMKGLGSATFKKRRNAFYILNFLIQTQPDFAEMALKQFSCIASSLKKDESIPKTIKEVQEQVRFRVFTQTKMHEWA